MWNKQGDMSSENQGRRNENQIISLIIIFFFLPHFGKIFKVLLTLPSPSSNLNWQYGRECQQLTLWYKKPWFLAFANLCGVNTSTWRISSYQGTLSWEEIFTIGSYNLAPIVDTPSKGALSRWEVIKSRRKLFWGLRDLGSMIFWVHWAHSWSSLERRIHFPQ